LFTITAKESELEFKLQEIPEMSLVVFKNQTKYKYGVVMGGFGCSLHTIGSAVFAILGQDIDECIEDFQKQEISDALSKAEMKLKGSVPLFKYKSFTDRLNRQPVKIIGHIDREAIKASVADEIPIYEMKYVFGGMPYP